MIKFRKFLKRAGKDEAGFTLIELMVVVVILGILATLVAPRIIGDYADDARESADAANQKMLQNAVDRLMYDTNQTVTTFDIAAADMTNALVGPGTGFTNWSGPYITSVPDKQFTTGNWSVVNGIVQ